MKKELLEYSYKHGLSHIPSALSMFDYVWTLFNEKLVTIDDHIVIGKPFGAQAYYLIWRELGLLDNIESLSMGLKHDEIPFVDYSEETIGNALGVATGIAMASDKLVWVNITDATLQMGNTLEAIQFIGQKQLKNIMLTIDYNNSQVVGNTSDIINVYPIINMFKAYDWHVEYDLNNFGIELRPKVFILNTIKGNGVQTMIDDNKLWHYKKIESEKELQLLVAELQDT
jgi:transketolase N-terminal domain/subunit